MFSLGSFLDVRKEDRPLLYYTYYAFLVSGMMSTVLGAILPSLSAEYGLSYSVQGSLLSFHQIGNLAAVYLAGFLPYAIGRKRSTLLGASGIILGLVFMTLYGNPLFLMLAFALTGIGRGTLSNMTNVVVGQCAGNKAGGLNLLHASYAVGAFISPLIALAAGDSWWKWPCWAISALMLLSLVLIGTSSLSSERTKRDRDGGQKSFMKDFAFWLNTLIMLFYLCAEASLTGWLVTYFKDSGMLPASLAPSVQSLMWVTILVGRLMCASLSVRMNKAVLIMILGTVMTGFFALMVLTSSPAVAMVAVLGVGLSMSGIYPTTLSTMPGKYNSSTVATGTCIAVASVGGIVMPMIIGAVAETSGLASGISLILFALVVMLALMLTKLVLTLRGRV